MFGWGRGRWGSEAAKEKGLGFSSIGYSVAFVQGEQLEDL